MLGTARACGVRGSQRQASAVACGFPHATFNTRGQGRQQDGGLPPTPPHPPGADNRLVSEVM
eukprot:365166-Chlamydomonas_euryale.AAC.12